MNIAAWAWSSLSATVLLTTVMTGSQRMGWTRMSLPLMLGTAFTPNRDRALMIGTALHAAAGFVFGASYAAFFEWLGSASWWIGGIVGTAHGLLVLLAVFELLPGLHPRMASENHGPDPTRGLEPPGPFGCNYGKPTPFFTLLGHIAFGVCLGALYRTGG